MNTEANYEQFELRERESERERNIGDFGQYMVHIKESRIKTLIDLTWFE